MKKKEKSTLRAMSQLELVKYVSTRQLEIAKGMLDRVTKQIKNVHTFSNKRKEIAVAKTILREKSL